MICAIAELKCHLVSKSCVTLCIVWYVKRIISLSVSDMPFGLKSQSLTPCSAAACLSTNRYTRFKNLHAPSMLSSLHSKSFSGGAANNVYSLPAGSSCVIIPKSRITLHQNLEYSRCNIACVIPPMYWSIGNQYATFAESYGALSFFGSQY